MAVQFEPVAVPGDEAAIIDFLVASEWPFHSVSQLTPEDAARVCVAADDVASFWIREDGVAIGLIRLMDLTDLDDGSPVFDLRIAENRRGRGVGHGAVDWITRHLFTRYPPLHRIEATTRHDNVAMQTVFDRCGYRLEGRFVEAWLNADGTRCDALAYAILRKEHIARESDETRERGQ